MVRYRLDSTGHEVELVTYKGRRPAFGSSFDLCWRQTWWDVAFTNQSSKYWWIIIPLCLAISFNSFATTVSSMGAVDRPKYSTLNWYVRPCLMLAVKSQVFPGLFLYRYMEVGVLEIY